MHFHHLFQLFHVRLEAAGVCVVSWWREDPDCEFRVGPGGEGRRVRDFIRLRNPDLNPFLSSPLPLLWRWQKAACVCAKSRD